MRYTLITLWVLSYCYAYTQTNFQPLQLVNTAKTQSRLFEKTALFSSAASDAGDYRALKDKHQIMDLDEEALQQLLFDQPGEFLLTLPSAQGRDASMELELVRVFPLTDDFSVLLASTGQMSKSGDNGMHYRGIIRGQESSVVAFSFFENDVMGLISAPETGNLVLGKIADGRQQEQYILYNDREVFRNSTFECGASDEGAPYLPEEIKDQTDGRNTGDCVRIYLEIDHDVFQSKGGATGTTNYITGLFNQVATLYANENINAVLSQIYLWDSPSPYYSTSSYTLLTQFVNLRPSFNGDLGQLISYQASGGIAYLSGLCSSFSPKHSFSSISSTYSNVPTYSWSVMVVTHELGHLFGSRHTHACVWNGNGTAIDGCAGYVEGNCALPGYPAGGGTIMSYCHLRSVGINLSLGFGSQPGNVIRNAVTNASCLQACSDGGGDPGGDNPDTGCAHQELSLKIVLDTYGAETSWELRDSNDIVLYSGGPYPASSNGSVVETTMCLGDGCYFFQIYDSYGDGICCDFGLGSYTLKDSSGYVIATGGQFDSTEEIAFCLPFESGENDCENIDFSEYTINSFGGGQDGGSYSVLEDGDGLFIQNNAWKSISYEYEVTPNTMLEFEFGSTIQGEIHGIGFDNNNSISANYTFRVYGTQSWGYGDYDTYPGGAVWKSYTIPVGEYYSGRFDRIFFVADHDRSPRNGNSFFRNVRIYEGVDGCGQNLDSPVFSLLEPSSPFHAKVYPNPANDYLNIEVQSEEIGEGVFQLYAITGQLLAEQRSLISEGLYREQMEVQHLPEGAYLLKLTMGQEQHIEKIQLIRP